ncbi:transcriptional regulator, TetR family [Monaibacterium marinum]|uniref:Transcriptional regulator, TetR family n=1 Tax=Pontivivens marinum TaxID=1690039 RepID=A0A2C9CUG6_9RHOB|nr:TetR/AcrR family transcriptional regulator [Monaibacterium marinum]SOH94850.1 transcriptional regulator, TetR family [Monaibacterium marinum]
MTLSLREKRRLETARDIHKVTLNLAEAHGLDEITTEEIAAAASISTRTFFNYYANKEAAAIGTPPGFRAEDKRALCTGTTPISQDLKTFLDTHIARLAENETILRKVRKIAHENAKARAVLDSILASECEELATCLRSRLVDPHVATALANFGVTATAQSIRLWERSDDLSLPEAFNRIWNSQIAAAQLLTVSTS